MPSLLRFAFAVIAFAWFASASRSAGADETYLTRVTGPTDRDYARRADCGWDVIAREGDGISATLPVPPGKPPCEARNDAVVSSDDAWLAAPQGLWNLRTRKWVGRLPDGWGFAFSRSGRYLAYIESPPFRNEADFYLRRSRVVLLDLKTGAHRKSPRVVGHLSNSAPISFAVSPPRVLVFDYEVTLFSIPALVPTSLDPRRMLEIPLEDGR